MGRRGEPSPAGEGSRRSPGESTAPTIITSRKNPVIQDLRSLLQSSSRRTARCVVEGWRFVETAAAGGVDITLVVHTPAAAAHPRGEEMRGRLHAAGVRLIVVSPYVFDSLTQVDAPQGVLGIVRRPPDASPAILDDAKAWLAVLDGVQDPGNAGAILRTAVAAGATGGVVAGVAADPFGSKAIRASAGAVFQLPLLFFPSASHAAAALQRHGVRVLVADPRGDRLASEVSYARPLALVFGSEGAGAARAWTPSGIRIRLPMAGAMESLGVAAAAAVLLYRAGEAAGPRE
ncbi:MAG TPA: RNA methyltransferase [bacterium]|nr:RNA methyltransferase [bacterium]